VHQDALMDNNVQAVNIEWNNDNSNTNNHALRVYSNTAHPNSNAVNTIVRFRNDHASSLTGQMYPDLSAPEVPRFNALQQGTSASFYSGGQYGTRTAVLIAPAK
jgi:hypothetical protein